MKKLFGGKSKNRANGSSRDLSAEETASQATVPTPIHAKLATTTPPATGVKARATESSTCYPTAAAAVTGPTASSTAAASSASITPTRSLPNRRNTSKR
ncbi:hypothetical protein FA13DRAFT_1509373 [Coprinellus micaceus]|uniref:Uncharacterized protein n=1 Tax=Coprinellus micaceus TaxID=71717 RepID=A0A4Y7SKS5_COPMI|nr:hypothetical protein FA13DRAFT_1509373 [Coprinellus micaceus]